MDGLDEGSVEIEGEEDGDFVGSAVSYDIYRSCVSQSDFGISSNFVQLIWPDKLVKRLSAARNHKIVKSTSTHWLDETKTNSTIQFSSCQHAIKRTKINPFQLC